MISLILKEETKQEHDKTEESLQSNKIFDKSYTLENYKNLLIHNYFLVSKYEPQVNKFLHKYPELKLDTRRKILAITSDLDNLNVDINNDSIAHNLDNEAEAFGALYVMEGSTLGGNVIMKQLRKNPAFEDITFNYFGIYGNKTGLMWQEFKAFLDERISEKDYQSCITGARKAYRILA